MSHCDNLSLASVTIYPTPPLMSAEPTYIPIMNLGQHSSKQSVGLVLHLMHGVKWVLTLSNVKATNLFPYLPWFVFKTAKNWIFSHQLVHMLQRKMADFPEILLLIGSSNVTLSEDFLICIMLFWASDKLPLWLLAPSSPMWTETETESAVATPHGKTDRRSTV